MSKRLKSLLGVVLISTVISVLITFLFKKVDKEEIDVDDFDDDDSWDDDIDDYLDKDESEFIKLN
jgi:hypothetical protein